MKSNAEKKLKLVLTKLEHSKKTKPFILLT